MISDDVVLSAADVASGINANNPRIGWHNLVTAANVSAETEDPDFPATNLANPLTYLKWKADASTSESVVSVTLSPADTVNYFAIARHNLGTIGAEYVFEYFNGSVWTALTTPAVPANDYAIIHQFEDTFASQFRLRIEGTGDAPEISVLHLGRITILQRRIYVGHTPFPFGRDTTVSSGFSEEGQYLGRVVRRRMYQSSVSMNNLTAAWVRSTLDPFIEASADQAWFWAWRPGGYPLEVGYAWCTGDVKVTNSRSNGMMSAEWSFQGLR